MSKKPVNSVNTVRNVDLWNAILELTPEQRAQVLSIVNGMRNVTPDNAPEPEHVYGIVMTKKVAPAVFSAIHHACKDGGATWSKSEKMWTFESAKARDKVLNAQKKYAEAHEYEYVLAKA